MVVRYPVSFSIKAAISHWLPCFRGKYYPYSTATAGGHVFPQCIHRHYSNIPSIKQGPDLKSFLASATADRHTENQPENMEELIPYINTNSLSGNGRQVYFETYGCQMNVNDTEIAWSILKDAGYTRTTIMAEADVILAVTCAIRENAETKIWKRLNDFKSLKNKRKVKGVSPVKIGILGCMAERLKERLLEMDKMVDLVVGPDAYRDLPRILSITQQGQPAVNVQLSLDETYGDVTPVRLCEDSPSAYVSIMRGCDNMCSFCIVPFTRGRERSRPMSSILDEIRALSNNGVKEVTLLGQNVNSYRDLSDPGSSLHSSFSRSSQLSTGFTTIYRDKDGGRRFAELLHNAAQVDPEMRVRFTSPHPKDFPIELLHVIQSHDNICNHVHLPAQSGSTAVLQRMRRGHSRESYLDLVQLVRETIPDVSLSSDFITGFCGETEADHIDTLTLMDTVGYDMAYMFAYSMRKKTHAYHRMADDVPADVKQRRLQEITDLFYSLSSKLKQKYVNTEQLVLVEGKSKKSDTDLAGRADSNTKVVFPAKPLPSDVPNEDGYSTPKPGDYVKVKVLDATAITLKGTGISRTNIGTFKQINNKPSN